MTNLYAVIPAAGSGQRFGATIPKQYHDLNGRCILQRSIDSLLKFSVLQKVICAIAADDHYYSQHIDPDPRLLACQGGATRAASVFNALKLIPSGADDDSWVMVHDAARPLVTTDSLSALWSAAQTSDGQGATLALASVDALHASADGRTLSATQHRQSIWRAQTPQCFPLSALIQALEKNPDVGDETAAMIKLGFQPRVVIGDPANFKITYLDDLDLARFYLENQR